MTTSRRSNTIISTIIFISLCIIAITITRQSTINLRLRNENSEVSARRTITDSSQIIMSSRQQQESVHPRTNNMVGGYSNLGHDKNLLKSEQVVKVSNYALKEHSKKSTSTASGHALTISPDEVESGQVTAVVLEAQQQVSLPREHVMHLIQRWEIEALLPSCLFFLTNHDIVFLHSC
mmetsp:Transcript_33912/g.57272  ORF Transcript_33912/g.57272 Transcript_33912/m.57272 type:complete len:178 (-) Transcript_33912:440-973(-)